ncbi:MAG: divalent cation tolerance protein CutA [Chloroflexi bacterium]|nr:divalent cation tolerance protein CutA [Ktedonobacteraceae bacterium]MBV9020930.1 divalent cation tolerance protein CutA [Ktedonobacteraceae bacterium]MBV9706975.1 divalent cation tolerance protein CutA [Chloroflexota bacterium]
MTEFVIVPTSIDSQDAAQHLADAAVTKRLAACCWVSGPVQSTYWWKGHTASAYLPS